MFFCIFISENQQGVCLVPTVYIRKITFHSASIVKCELQNMQHNKKLYHTLIEEK